jgi:hypothetical protein
VRGIIDRVRFRRLVYRGDLVAGWADALQLLLDLGEDLLPGTHHEIPRDLFGLLAYSWAAQASPEGGSYDPRPILVEIRRRAWAGYADLPSLLALIRADLPRGATGRHMVAFFEELSAKQATYLFLPIVAAIDRHQSGDGPITPGSLEVDGLTERNAAKLVNLRELYAALPGRGRQADIFTLAMFVAAWDRSPWSPNGPELTNVLAVQLRQLWEAPDAALASLREDAAGRGPVGRRAADLLQVAQEVCDRVPWAWLDALFFVEQWRSGPQWFEHAMSIGAIPHTELMRRVRGEEW